MSKQRQRDTQPEILLRRELHSRGLRFRISRRPVPAFRSEADIVFGPARISVYVDGCFWHGCPQHATWPVANAEWWRSKIELNRARDRKTDEVLKGAGWTVLRVWEHEDPVRAADRVEAAVRARRAQTQRGSDRLSGATSV
jgi:DNA mismatch endonuclease (patch repair protein)